MLYPPHQMNGLVSVRDVWRSNPQVRLATSTSPPAWFTTIDVISTVSPVAGSAGERRTVCASPWGVMTTRGPVSGAAGGVLQPIVATNSRAKEVRIGDGIAPPGGSTGEFTPVLKIGSPLA